MSLSEVGLVYVSKNASQFINNVQQANFQIGQLNKSLISIGNKPSKQLDKSFSTVGGSTNLLTDSIKDNTKAIQKSIKIYDVMGNVLDKTHDKNLETFETYSSFPPKVQKATDSIQKFANIIIKDEKQRKIFNTQLISIIKTFVKIPGPVLVATTALTAFSATSFLLETFGKRASGLDAVSDSFDRLRMQAGLSTDFLSNFAESADNQLKQSELLVLSNKALAGSTGEFQTELANTLPTLLEFARVRAGATGEDVNFLFESLIQGIKKGQPLILDNLGLVVKLEETYEAYAKTLNTTASALTGTQKQQALLQSVNAEALRNIDILGEASLSNADKMSARGNIIADILDDISLAIQPLLSSVLDIQLFFTSMLKDTLQPFTSILKSLFSVIAQQVDFLFGILKPPLEFLFTLIQTIISPFEALFRVFARLTQFVIAILKPITGLFKIFEIGTSILKGVTKIFSTLGDFLVGMIAFFQKLGSIVSGFIGKLLSPLINTLSKVKNAFAGVGVTIKQLGDIMAVGFGRSVGSLVNTFAKATLEILKLVGDLAQGIADFLIGQSPPPKGPLSKIDSGGKKTFEAFLDGFTNTSLKPVEKVAKEVDMELGKIGQFSVEQVDKRLSQLDLAIRPFNEQLEIAKSRFEAISAPAEAALNAIDRQLDKAVEALTKGDASAMSSVKALDAQRASIIKNLDLQQQEVEFAQIQLALKQAQQTEERALLNIQKKRLGGQELSPLEKEKLKKSKSPKSATANEKRGGGASEVEGVAEEFAGIEESATGSELGDLMFAGFEDALNMDLFAQIGDEQERIGSEAGRIGEGLEGLGDKFLEPFEFLLGDDGVIKSLWNDFFGAEGTISTSIDNAFGENGFVKTKIDSMVSFFTTPFEEGGLISNAITGLFGIGGTARTSIQGWSDSVSSQFQEGGSLYTGFQNFFGEEGTLSTLFTGFFGEEGTVDNLVENIFGENGTFRTTINSVFGEDSFWATSLTMVSDKFVEFKDDFIATADLVMGILTGDTNSIGSALDMLFNLEDGTVATTLDNGISLFTNFWDTLFGEEGVFAGLGTVLDGLINQPMLTILTGVQLLVNAFITYLEDSLNNIGSPLKAALKLLPAFITAPIQGFVESGDFEFPRVQFSIPQAKKGGLFSGGLMSVGENGQEFISPANKIGVFPNNFVTAIQSLESVLVQSMNVPSANNVVSNSNTTNNNNTSQVFNINQPMSAMTMRQQFNQMG